MASKKPQKTPLKYNCDICDFKCSNKKDYNRHIMTAKHKAAYIGLQDASKKPQNIIPSEKINDDTHKCICGMVYAHRQSLYRHMKKCTENAKNAKHTKSTYM